MTTPSTNPDLLPAINVLAKVLARTSEDYQQLLNRPEAIALCIEVGRSIRYVSGQYARVLLAALGYEPDAFELAEDDVTPLDDEDFDD